MGDEKVKRKGKIRENITISWEMNKKKNGVKKKCWKWMDDVIIDVALPEYSSNKCYTLASAFRYR